MNKAWWIVALVFLLPTGARAEDWKEAVKKIDGVFEPAEAHPGQTVTLKVDVQLDQYWYTYPTKQTDPEAKTYVNRFLLPDPGELIFIGPVEDPLNVKTKSVTSLKISELRYYPDGATWEIKAVVSPKATPGEKSISLKQARISACWKKPDGSEGCLTPKVFPISAKLKVVEGPVTVDDKYREIVEKAVNGKRELPPKEEAKSKEEPKTKEAPSDTPKSSPTEPKQTAIRIPRDADYAADIDAVRSMLPKYEVSNIGFIGFIVTAMFWGVVTLLTPCVFPMVPITVSFFLKQGEKKLHNPVVMALVYTLTIIAVLGFAARFALGFFRWLSVDPWMNAALGILFIAFAMSLFGMFDIVLPSFLVRFTSSREGKGGYGGVIFMALSFSIVSFTCVAPFLGGFAGMAASGQFNEVQLLAGAFAFAAAFALPFFLLALFPTLLKKLPKSGGWMNTIKVVMGFLELAAALKFFRNAELRWTTVPALFTYDFVLSAYIVILFLTGLYLLNLFRLPHDEPQEHIGVPRMLVGFLSISVGLYLLPGLFSAGSNEKQRPGGTLYAWIDAFLLPDPGAGGGGGENELPWSGNLRASIEAARERGETVFVDFTGETCTNCKLNERNVFPKPEVKALLKKLRLVQFYTDEVPENFYEWPPGLDKQDLDAKKNLDFQKAVFGDEKLPLYALLRPEAGPPGSPVQIVGVYGEGKINNDDQFIEFLKKGVR